MSAKTSGDSLSVVVTSASAADFRPLLEYEKLGPDARLSVPTPEHYLPLLYVLGTRQVGDGTTFPIEGVDGGSISMLAVRVGR